TGPAAAAIGAVGVAGTAGAATPLAANEHAAVQEAATGAPGGADADTGCTAQTTGTEEGSRTTGGAVRGQIGRGHTATTTTAHRSQARGGRPGGRRTGAAAAA